jgi:hypothetical protein
LIHAALEDEILTGWNCVPRAHHSVSSYFLYHLHNPGHPQLVHYRLDPCTCFDYEVRWALQVGVERQVAQVLVEELETQPNCSGIIRDEEENIYHPHTILPGHDLFRGSLFPVSLEHPDFGMVFVRRHVLHQVLV